MKIKTTPFTERYVEVLQIHLNQGSRATKILANQLGHEALKIKIQTLELARIHDFAWTQLTEPRGSFKSSAKTIKCADLFFYEVIKPIEETHVAILEARERRDEQISALRSRSSELLFSNRELKKEVIQRKSAEESLKKSEHHQKVLLLQSRQRKEQLRYLSRQILLEQEEQRRAISRELHDEIAQILAGINVHLAALKIEATMNAKGLSKKITNTQRLVEKSVKIVHRFACELRPAVLDDLGIIPALNTYLTDFTRRTGIQIDFKAFAGVEQLNSTKRTVLFRVAQAALANVAQHSRATLVRIEIKQLSDVVCLEIHDDGKSFEVARVLSAKTNEHLGLIGMRERVEMVGGSFNVESTLGQGTTIFAEIPSHESRRGQSLRIKKTPSILV